MPRKMSGRRHRRPSTSKRNHIKSAPKLKPSSRQHDPRPSPTTPAPISIEERLYTARVHRSQASLLSSDTTRNVNFRGFMNLGMLIVVITNAKDIIKNLKAYGWQTDLYLSNLSFSSSSYTEWPCLSAFVLLSLHILAAVFLERYVALPHPNLVKCGVVPLLQALNAALSLFVPIAVILIQAPNPGTAIVLMLFSMTLCMKLVSYSMVNNRLRRDHFDALLDDTSSTSSASSNGAGPSAAFLRERSSSSDSLPEHPIAYPENLTIGNIAYFIAVPTLVYQTTYPTAPRVRKTWLLKRVVEMVICSALTLTIVQQYLVPVAHQGLMPIQNREPVEALERLFALAIPNLYVWLLGFYVFFHLYMNVLAEIMCFGDKVFYLDWWNARNLDQFWRKWNIPVHNFMKYHVYVPLVIERGYNKNLVTLFIFFLSAVAHEVVVSVPFRSLNAWAFLGMMAQIPLVFITRNANKSFGNIVFWLSILLGQPLGVLFYMIDYYERVGYCATS